ncbi:MAG: endonuclease [Bacteroidetes bacterium]|nr:endonuclease [Bacteroidota bacterium]
MTAFRETTPKHRVGRKTCKKYTTYKKTLREDFLKRCGYCDDVDELRIRSYVIDHFLPRKPDGWTHTIPDNKYENLIYACPFCNSAKKNKWPTRNYKKSHDGIQGFVNPTLIKYGKLFRRNADGSIAVFNGNPLAKYIHENLALNQPIHALNWKFEKILKQEKILKTLHNSTTDPIIQASIRELRAQQGDLAAEIRGIYNK